MIAKYSLSSMYHQANGELAVETYDGSRDIVFFDEVGHALMYAWNRDIGTITCLLQENTWIEDSTLKRFEFSTDFYQSTTAAKILLVQMKRNCIDQTLKDYCQAQKTLTEFINQYA